MIEESKFLRKVKTGDGLMRQYHVSPDCKVCQAVDENGKNRRLDIDRHCLTHSYPETTKWANGLGCDFTYQNLKYHIRTHSEYLLDVKNTIIKSIEKKALSRVESIESEYIEPETVIEEIITLGGQKIRSGEMQVSEKLLLGALKEEGSRKKQGRLRDLLDDLEQTKFKITVEGETSNAKAEGGPTPDLQN